MKTLFILLAVIFSTTVSAEKSVENQIKVIGKAAVKAQPDKFVFTVTINERGAIASKTKALVDQKSRLVTNMYTSMGIAKNMIESARLQLTPRYEKQPQLSEFELHQRLNRKSVSNARIVVNSKDMASNPSNKQPKIYFDVTRTITVTFGDFTLYDQLLDKVVKIGVSRISPLQTTITNNEALYQEALLGALKNARNKAESIAKQIGVKLGKLSSFEESSEYAPRAYMMANKSSENFNSSVSQKNVSAQVNVIFSIE